MVGVIEVLPVNKLEVGLVLLEVWMQTVRNMNQHRCCIIIFYFLFITTTCWYRVIKILCAPNRRVHREFLITLYFT